MKRLRWGREVAATYSKEVRCLVRDQHTVIYSVIVPVFLYPALVWGVIQVLTYARAVQDRAVSTVRLVDRSSVAGLREHLEEIEKLRLLELDAGDPTEKGGARGVDPGGLGSATPRRPEELTESARAELTGEDVDAWVFVEKRANAPDASDLLPEIEVAILFNSSLDSSVKARERLEEGIEAFRRERLVLAARDLGQDDDFVSPLTLTETDLASAQELGNYVASLILPLLMLIMTALGALYPALDLTVGEKERGCLETTLLAPVGRHSIVVGKYLAVVSFALIAFLLNFSSMAFTLFHQGSVLKLESFEIGWSSGVIILAAALLLSAFFSAIMMLLAFQARTFKEGQSYVTPVYLLAVIPTLLVASPEVTFDMTKAWVPVVNIALLFRGALQGSLSTPIAVASLASSVLYAIVVLSLSVWYLQRREVISERAGRRFSLWSRRDATGPFEMTNDE